MYKRSILKWGFILSLAAASESFSVTPRPIRTLSSAKTSSALHMSAASTSTGFEFPDDVPERGSSSGGTGRGISSSELRKMSEARQQRIRDEEEQANRFLTGDDLHMLRKQVLNLRRELDNARSMQADDRVKELERAIIKAQQLDAEFIYEVSLEKMELAEQMGDQEEVEKWRKEAMKARSALPAFNLGGLWVGKYGDHGFEMINVTYSGDLLIARKVTGDKTVPQGEVTFSVDLSPKKSPKKEILEPIELGNEASKQWGTKYLSRFAGLGHVASPGFTNSQWVDGQLILVNDYFSFAWLPIGHQVFFGRPSPELTLKLMRESRSKQFADDKAREHLLRCWEETEHLEDDMEVSDGPFRSHNQQDYYSLEGCFE